MAWIDAAASGVEGNFTDRNPHAASAEVAKTENAFAIADDDDLHIGQIDLVEQLFNAVFVWIGDEEASGSAVNFMECLASLADNGGIDEGEHLRHLFC